MMMRINALLFVSMLGIASLLRAAEIPNVDCSRIEAWSAKYEKNSNIPITPKVQINSLLSDENILPLFGETALAMSGDKLSAIGQQMQNCRKAAAKRKDKAALTNITIASKAVRSANSSLQRIDRYVLLTRKSVDDILQSKPFPGLAKVIDLAKQALSGEDVSRELSADRSLGVVSNNVRTIQNSYDWLPEANRQEFIAALEEREVTAIAEAKEHESALAIFRDEMANVPENQAGINRLIQMSQDPILQTLDNNEAYAIRQQINNKRYDIQQKMQQEQAKEAAADAAKPMEIVKVLEQLITGDGLEDISLRGLKPGISSSQAGQILARSWYGYRLGNSMDYASSYALKRSDMSALIKAEKRNGGAISFTVLNDQSVGRITYEELYKAVVQNSSVQAWLTNKIGKPEKVSGTLYTGSMLWENGDVRVLVRTGGVDVLEKGVGYRSKMIVSLWNEDYEEFEKEKKQKCDELRKTPRSELSYDDSAWFLQNCPLL